MVAVFGISAAAGYFLVGPNLNGNKQEPSTSAPFQKSAADPETSPSPVGQPEPKVEAPTPKLKIDISESPDSQVAGEQPTASRQKQTQMPPETKQGKETTTENSNTASPTDDSTVREKKNTFGEAPDSATAKKPPPSRVKASSMWRVQLGAFSDETSAKQLADQIMAQGQAAYVAKDKKGSQDVWRVQAGVYKKKANAESVAQKLSEAGIKAAIVSVSAPPPPKSDSSQGDSAQQ